MCWILIVVRGIDTEDGFYTGVSLSWRLFLGTDTTTIQERPPSVLLLESFPAADKESG